MKPIGLASDHAGFELKQYVKQWLEAKGWEYKDFGTYTRRRHQYDPEQTPGHTRRTLLDSRNFPLGTPT